MEEAFRDARWAVVQAEEWADGIEGDSPGEAPAAERAGWVERAGADVGASAVWVQPGGTAAAYLAGAPDAERAGWVERVAPGGAASAVLAQPGGGTVGACPAGAPDAEQAEWAGPVAD